MAILLADCVWEGLSTESKPTYEDGARDGHFYKELDSGESYHRVSGIWEYVNLGLSFIKATKSGEIVTDANGQAHVSFTTPFINTSYGINLTIEKTSENERKFAYFSNVLVDGFDIETVSSNVGSNIYSFANLPSDILTYKQLISLPLYLFDILATKRTNISTNPTLMETFATNSSFPNITSIPVGVFTCYYQTEKAAGSNNYYTYFEIYKRSLDNMETLLATSNTTDRISINTIVNNAPSAAISSSILLLATDRLVIKIYGVMLSSTANIDLFYDDTTNSRLEFPAGVYPAGNVAVSWLATRDYNP